MGWSIERKTTLGFGAALLIVIVVGFIAYQNGQQFIKTNNLVAHTLRILDEAEATLLILVDAETSQRGYIITANEDYLQPYRSTPASIDRHMKRLRELTADNPDHQARLEALEPLITEKFDLMEEAVILRRSVSFSAAQQRITAGRSKAVMDDFRALIAEIQAEESDLLEGRTAETEATARVATITFLVLTVLVFVLLTSVYAVVTREIRERKRSEDRIQKLNQDLERRAAELQAANKELESFSYSVSHDLRAPLRSIDGFSLALLEDYAEVIDSAGQSYLQRVRAASQRMAELIDDLLSLARISRTELNLRRVNLSALVQSIATDLQQEEPTRAVEFVIGSGIVTHGDESLLRAALENLLGNAWKFTGKKISARIEFGAMAQSGGQNVYFVRDNGDGFDMAYADKLFGAFQRLHDNNEFAGTGIGLATVQRIIHRHGGQVWAESAVGHGATFYFQLYAQRGDSQSRSNIKWTEN